MGIWSEPADKMPPAWVLWGFIYSHVLLHIKQNGHMWNVINFANAIMRKPATTIFIYFFDMITTNKGSYHQNCPIQLDED